MENCRDTNITQNNDTNKVVTEDTTKDIVNVFDFDGTIYDGESLIDCFFFYLWKGNFWRLKHVPSIIIGAILYKLRLISVDGILARTSKMAGTVLQSAKKHDVHQVTAEFWKKHTKKLKPDILKLVKEDDLIITACPRQILEGIIEQLPTKKFICSEVDMQIGDFTFLCARENKIKAFYEKYPNTSIDTFYTDSLNDKPLMELAHNVYLVRWKRIKKIK